MPIIIYFPMSLHYASYSILQYKLTMCIYYSYLHYSRSLMQSISSLVNYSYLPKLPNGYRISNCYRSTHTNQLYLVYRNKLYTNVSMIFNTSDSWITNSIISMTHAPVSLRYDSYQTSLRTLYVCNSNINSSPIETSLITTN